MTAFFAQGSRLTQNGSPKKHEHQRQRHYEYHVHQSIGKDVLAVLAVELS
jgi:hypothetical protein